MTGVRVQQWSDVNVVKHGLVQLQFALDKEPFLVSLEYVFPSYILSGLGLKA